MSDDLRERAAKAARVFSGDASRPFWNAVNRVKGPKTHATLYDYGCKAQEMESELEALRAQRDTVHAAGYEAGARGFAAHLNEIILANPGPDGTTLSDALARFLSSAPGTGK